MPPHTVIGARLRYTDAVDIRDELTAARGRKETARADLVVLVQRAALVEGLSAYQIREATGLNRRTIAAMLEPATPT